MIYTLHSTKGQQQVDGTLAQAVVAALAMEAELQPAFGVTILDEDDDTLATIADGAHDLVVLETMPEHLRASHEAARNRGEYPHNGAQRVIMDRANAKSWDDGDWTVIVRPATERDLEQYGYAVEI